MVVRALDRKLLRDLGAMRGSVATIAIVVACGITALVTMRSAYDSLAATRDFYYDRYRFGDVFVHLERAPRSVAARLAAIPGVAAVEARIVESGRVLLPGRETPDFAQVVSLPASGQPRLHRLHLRSGAWPRAERRDEALVLASFAEAHGLVPGDAIDVVLEGHRRALRIAGTAMSPEFVFPIAPGDITANADRFAVLWMNEEAVGPTFDMDGAFNDVVLDLRRDAAPLAVREEVDRTLDRFGGLGAYDRTKQVSSFMLDGELSQLKGLATFVPILFLAVAAFLLNVVLGRLVQLQRATLATLKAVGYDDRAIGAHYLGFVLVVVGIGAVLGSIGGAWLGHAMTELYTQFFHFPILRYELDPALLSVAILISFAAGATGALATVRSIARMPPAEAMRPESPARYRRTFAERLGIDAIFGVSGRMVLRELTRRPLRALLSSLAIATGVGVCLVGRSWNDAIDYLIVQQFERAQREDLDVAFTSVVPARTITALHALPGVIHVEGSRIVPARVRSGALTRDVAITALPDEPSLRRLIDAEGTIVRPPAAGLLLSEKLAEILGAHPGGIVDVEIREGARPRFRLPVAGTVDDLFGLQIYARRTYLEDVLGEPPLISMASLRLDPRSSAATLARLRDTPRVASVLRPSDVVRGFREQTGQFQSVFAMIITLFAIAIAMGVVYNNARVVLSMRSRELASLRVLGFERHEIAAILIGELAVHVLVALPIGLWLGRMFSEGMAAGVDPETYRFRPIVSSSSDAFAVLVTLAAAAASASIVRRQLDHLDLVGVLKTRE